MYGQDRVILGNVPYISPCTNKPLQFSDEQERIQKATFTRWCNAHLAKAQPPRQIDDLYEDLKDGVALCQLIEVLTGDKLVSSKNCVTSQRTTTIYSSIHVAQI